MKYSSYPVYGSASAEMSGTARPPGLLEASVDGGGVIPVLVAQAFHSVGRQTCVEVVGSQAVLRPVEHVVLRGQVRDRGGVADARDPALVGRTRRSTMLYPPPPPPA